MKKQLRIMMIGAHCANDYHADHRNAALLVQDASYLLIVPNYVSDAPALSQIPVILHYRDRIRYPPFHADVAIGMDEVIDDKFRMTDFHKSQVHEWFPWTYGTLDLVPQDPAPSGKMRVPAGLSGIQIPGSADQAVRRIRTQDPLCRGLRGFRVRFASDSGSGKRTVPFLI